MSPSPSAPAAADADKSALGIGLMLLALFLLATMDAIAKHLTESLAIPQILAIRFWIFFLFACAMARRDGFSRSIRSARPGLQALRAFILVCEMSLFIFAFSRMPLADVHAIAAISPLLVMALAAAFLGERIGPHRWAAVAMGFVGVTVIIRPGIGVFDPMALLPLAAAAGWAVYQALLRAVARHDGPVTTTFFTATVGLVCFSLIAPFVWQAPDPMAWFWLLVIGALGSAGHFLLPAAYRLAPASTLQPFGYAMPVWAAVMGWAVFSHVPDRWTVIGGGIVIASGLYAFWRERRAKRPTR